MNPVLADIKSIINGHDFAKDKDRVFTYIEFVKMFGFENDPNIFITHYKEYVTRWAALKKEDIKISDADFIMSKMVDILKSITLDYSTYEEQDFIAHIDLTNKQHLKALSALYSRKIRQITEFYRKKRNESVLIVNRNSIKGSTKSIQEVIYEKVFDYLFSDRNIVPSYVNIKRDLLVSVENYVDIYSEYFDIPRQKEFTDKTRADMLSANMNDVDYRVYLEIELVISEILFSGNVFLEEIPLIAQLGVDLSQNCVGDMLALKNTLLANTTINQVPLTEQVALKRRLYEKFLGCDLYYMYVDLQGNIQMDVLCKADNPSGNLLNCGTADTATIENEQLELLSHIGLFFKPDKTSILKVNAKDFVWSVDTDVIQNDTMYVFPDPTRYGDIGNNKSSDYPLIMEFKLDYDIRNMSSGESVNDPLMFISDQGWRSYYSKQEDDFKNIKNINYEYSFTSLANRGFLSDYQTDVWGNQFGILKGCSVEYKYANDGKTIIGINKITLPEKYTSTEITYNGSEVENTGAVLFNGGYFENPFYQGMEIYDPIKEKFIWTFQGDENDTRPFDFTRSLILDDDYNWSGVNIVMDNLYYSDYTNNCVSFGTFETRKKINYVDHFQSIGSEYNYIQDKDNIITEVLLPFLTQNVFEDPSYEIETYNKSFQELHKEGGDLYIRMCGDINNKPLKFSDAFPKSRFSQITCYDDIVNVHCIHNTLIVETKDRIEFIPYTFDGDNFINTLGIRELLSLNKTNFLETKIVFNEVDKCFYILQLDSLTLNNNTEIKKLRNTDETIQENIFRRFLIPRVYKFDPINYKIKEIMNFCDALYLKEYEDAMVDHVKLWSDYVIEKERIQKKDNLQKLKTLLLSSNEHEYSVFRDFEISYNTKDFKLKSFDFNYNSSLGIWLLTISDWDSNNTPYIHEYRFKLLDIATFAASLISNIYTLKDKGTTYTWNNKINATQASVIPNNALNVSDNTIFNYYSQDDGLVFFTPKTFTLTFSENDSGKTVNGTKIKWDSNTYIGNSFFLELEKKIKLKGNCTLTISLENEGKNRGQIGFTSVNVGGKIEKEGGYEHFKNDFGITTTYYENITVTGKSFEILVDSIGNISGNVELPFLNDDYKSKKRTITGFIRIKIHGTVEAPIVEVLGATWDVTDYSINFGIDTPEFDEPDSDNPDHIFKPDIISLGEDGTQIIGEKHYNWTSKIYKGDNLIEIDEFELNPYCYLKGKLTFTGQISHVGQNTINVSSQDLMLKDSTKAQYSIDCQVESGQITVGVDLNGNITTISPYYIVEVTNTSNLLKNDVSIMKITMEGNARKLNIKIETVIYEIACLYTCYFSVDKYGQPSFDQNDSNLYNIENGGQLLRNLSTAAENGFDFGTKDNPIEMPFLKYFGVGLYSSEVAKVHMKSPNITSIDRAFAFNSLMKEIVWYDDEDAFKNALSNLTNANGAFYGINFNDVTFVYNLPKLVSAHNMWGYGNFTNNKVITGNIKMYNLSSFLNGIAMFNNTQIKLEDAEVIADEIQDLSSKPLSTTNLNAYTGMINIFFNTTTGYDKNKAVEVLDKLVSKGWEVANNIGYMGNNKWNTGNNYARKVILPRGYSTGSFTYTGNGSYSDSRPVIVEFVKGVAGMKTEAERKQACFNLGTHLGSKTYWKGYTNHNNVWIPEWYDDINCGKIISEWELTPSLQDFRTKHAL